MMQSGNMRNDNERSQVVLRQIKNWLKPVLADTCNMLITRCICIKQIFKKNVKAKSTHVFLKQNQGISLIIWPGYLSYKPRVNRDACSKLKRSLAKRCPKCHARHNQKSIKHFSLLS